MNVIHNPILPGFYPDPSICRVEDDFYLVTSSFSYFPGIPIFHSRDLVHWEQIGHVLDRTEQVHLTYQDISTGIFAPTIRYHEGMFYVITTNVTTHENFICTAEDPAGRWSLPHVIKEAGGIDPSLFFDEDGSCYFVGTSPMGDTRYNHQVIVLGELDLDTFQIKGEQVPIGDGAQKDSYCPEGPHLYKRDGWYYLMIAEGGTEHFHAVTISRSRNIKGPYENYQGNPILTHRHLGENYPICNVGHGDLVECKDGSWYMVCLGSRLMDGYHKLLGRETFLVPVTWEKGWPIVSPGTGKVEWTYPAPNMPEWKAESKCGFSLAESGRGFGGESLGMEWNVLGTPYETFYRLDKDTLSIWMKAKNMVPWEYDHTEFDFLTHMNSLGNTKESMPFVGRRLCSMSFWASVTVKAELQGEESVGLVLLQNNANQLRLECKKGKEGQTVVFLTKTRYRLENGIRWFDEVQLGSAEMGDANCLRLEVEGNRSRFTFRAAAEGQGCLIVAQNVDGSFLGSETAGGFVGTYLGMFATGNGTESLNEAAFTDFIYHPLVSNDEKDIE